MILIQNIYHMLAYAFQVLKQSEYKRCETESFDNVADLLSAILVNGVKLQIKRGLGRAYCEETEALRCPRGKFETAASIKQQSIRRQQLVCTYDEFSIDSYLNRILKTTMQLLLRYDIPNKRKKELHNLLYTFAEVKALDPFAINWKVQFNRNNQHYQMLIAICHLVMKGLLQTTSDGSFKLLHFLDKQCMHRLYEKFILRYYQKHYPQLKASASRIDWALDDAVDTLLPIMQSDILLTYKEKTLIIDAKYYEQILQTQYEKRSIHSDNLYQIFTYVKNKAALGGDVSGLLLYAQTNEAIYPNNTYLMSGNRIAVKTLNLNSPFSEIAQSLNQLVDDFLLR